MAEEPKGPSTTTLKRLFAASANRCAFPRCTSPLVLENKVVGQICHICARSPEGPRFDPSQTALARHSFENLILLCGTHHAVVDDDVEAYTVERLRTMKSRHEAGAKPMTEAEAENGGLILSLNQSGGITAHSVSVGTAHFYAAPRTDSSTSSHRANAIAMLAPELARILAHQIWALDRAVANFICASVGHAAPGDHWTVFRPRKPTLYPGIAQVRDLDVSANTLLAEFYSLLEEIDGLILSWQSEGPIWDCNTWNVLMQKIASSVTAGELAVEVYCPGRHYDPAMPSFGTLATRAASGLTGMRRALDAHIARHTKVSATAAVHRPSVRRPA